MKQLEPILEVKGLTTRFETQDGVVHAVNDVSFTLNKGEFLGVVGESGSGKSVTVMSLLRLIPMPPGEIVSGEAMFDGEDLLAMDMEELRDVRGGRIGFVFQDPMTSLNPVLKVGFQITEALAIHRGLDSGASKDRACELFEMVGIPDAKSRMSSYPHELSGGMRQRVMIAMALACSPEVVIADEPTTALDVTIQAQIIEIVKELRDRLGTAVIWITHDLGVIASLADRVVVMYGGQVVEVARVGGCTDRRNTPIRGPCSGRSATRPKGCDPGEHQGAAAGHVLRAYQLHLCATVRICLRPLPAGESRALGSLGHPSSGLLVEHRERRTSP